MSDNSTLFPSGMNTVLKLVGIGWYVGICIGAGAVLGMWGDNVFGFGPILTLLGIGLGILFAIAGMYRMLTAVLNSGSDNDN